MIDMIYTALCMHAHTEKTTFSFKDDKCKALTYDIGPGDKKKQFFVQKVQSLNDYLQEKQ